MDGNEHSPPCSYRVPTIFYVLQCYPRTLPRLCDSRNIGYNQYHKANLTPKFSSRDSCQLESQLLLHYTEKKVIAMKWMDRVVKKMQRGRFEYSRERAVLRVEYQVVLEEYVSHRWMVEKLRPWTWASDRSSHDRWRKTSQNEWEWVKLQHESSNRRYLQRDIACGGMLRELTGSWPGLTDGPIEILGSLKRPVGLPIDWIRRESK